MITGLFPVPQVVENDCLAEGSKAGAATGAAAPGAVRGMVPGTEAVVAYRARLRLCSLVLHFRGKGLRSGAFLFLAVRDKPVCGGDSCSSARSSPESGAVVTTEAAAADADAAAAAAATPKAVERGVAGGVVRKRPGGDGSIGETGGKEGEAKEMVGDREGGDGGGGGGDVESSSEEATENAKAAKTRVGEGLETMPRRSSGGGGDSSVTGDSGDDSTELWITDEAVPLLPALCARWPSWAAAAADAQRFSTEAQNSAAGANSPTMTAPAGSTEGAAAAAAAATGAPGERRSRDEGAGTPSVHQSPASFTLRVMPSGRSPLPPLCCGLCGSSWEMDPFGRSYRVYHLAVANNASLVWYLQKRFSEFLALHEALSGRGGGGSGAEGIPRSRWVCLSCGLGGC